MTTGPFFEEEKARAMAMKGYMVPSEIIGRQGGDGVNAQPDGERERLKDLLEKAAYDYDPHGDRPYEDEKILGAMADALLATRATGRVVERELMAQVLYDAWPDKDARLHRPWTEMLARKQEPWLVMADAVLATRAAGEVRPSASEYAQGVIASEREAGVEALAAQLKALREDYVELEGQHCDQDDSDCCGACHHDLRAQLAAVTAQAEALGAALDTVATRVAADGQRCWCAWIVDHAPWCQSARDVHARYAKGPE